MSLVIQQIQAISQDLPFNLKIEQEVQNNNYPIPKHLGIIPDGNRRWARKSGISIIKAHEVACDKFLPVLEDILSKTAIPIITIWGMSTENLNRPGNEVDSLFHALGKLAIDFLPTAHKYKCKLRRIGNISEIPRSLLQKFARTEKETEKYSRTINIAINYGGKWDILNAFNQFIAQNPGRQEITEDDINHYVELLKDDFPEPDLVIRTGADSKCKRTSGFFPWQTTYSEFYFIRKMLPEITFDDITQALKSFEQTNRRFGK